MKEHEYIMDGDVEQFGSIEVIEIDGVTSCICIDKVRLYEPIASSEPDEA